MLARLGVARTLTRVCSAENFGLAFPSLCCQKRRHARPRPSAETSLGAADTSVRATPAVVFILAAVTLHAASIRGTVVENQTGYPLARATVTVEPLGRASQSQSVHTNQSGIFEFKSLPAGTYRLFAAKMEFASVQYGQKRWYSPGMPIALAADDDASLTIRVPRFGAITGTVLDENDVGLPGHDVAVYTNSRPPRLLARSSTDDRGMYRLFDLRPGSYLVRSLAKQFEDESYLPTFYRDSPTVDPGHAIDVKLDDEVGHVDFHAITGRPSLHRRRPREQRIRAAHCDFDVGCRDGDSLHRQQRPFHHLQSHGAGASMSCWRSFPGDRTRGRMASFQLLMVDRDLTNVGAPLSPLPTVQFVFEDTSGHPLMLPEGSLLARRKDAASDGKAEQILSKLTLLPGRWDVAITPGPSYYVAGFEAPQQGSASDGRF